MSLDLLNTNDNEFPAKYTEIRDQIKNGDIVLYRGTGFLAKSIQYFDKAYYNHAGVVWRPEGEGIDKILTFDMWTDGLDCIPLSRRMEDYADFCIIRPNVSQSTINSALAHVLENWEGRDINYNYMLLLRIAMIKKTGIDMTGLGNKNKFICSQFAQFYTDLLGESTYSNINLITPEDFRRYMDGNFTKLFDNAPTPIMDFQKKIIWHFGGKDYTL